MTSLLLVDDEVPILKTLSLLLQQNGYRVETARDIAAARRVLGEKDIDVVITDLRLRDESGTDLLAYLRERQHTAGVIVMTAYGSIESAVECMRLGAFDYLTKPVKPQELLIRLEKLIEKCSLTEEVKRLRAEVEHHNQRDIVSKSPEMRRIVEIIHRIRDIDVPVLITGETGTGKEVVARAIHRNSMRAGKPMIAVNCCTLPEDLLDSELFGHARGAFTGAVTSSKGLFQQADGGTLFLDEIGDVSPRLQGKLLRVLQEGQIRPVGGSSFIDVDVRIVAATNRDLHAMMQADEFRSDLFFRLNVVPIHIPPLRDRPDDIQPLVERTLAELCERLGREVHLAPEAWEKLLLYDYPGNARQLANILERTVALAEGPVIDAEHIHLEQHGASPAMMTGVDAGEVLPGSEKLVLEDVAIRHIRRVLTLYKGNQVAAARALDISRSTLRRKLGLD